ncbi:MAG: beta-propeller fold lactonase family protein [Acidobacteria bacterium]|nr:beta-propeller fold lactonase family protein [Acidobacteriota bacterium]
MFQLNASIAVMAGGRTPADGKRLGEQMSKKISGCLTLLAFLGLTIFLVNCGSSSSRPAGLLYVLSQGENNVESYAIDLGNGKLSLTNKKAESDTAPSSILLDPSGKAAFVLNAGDKSNPSSLTSYTLNDDGSLSAPTPTALTVQHAVAMARDAAGTFLVVVSQGAIPLPPGSSPCPHPEPNTECPALTVFSIQSGSATLSQVGDPFSLDFVPTSVTTSVAGTYNNPKGGTVAGTLVHVTGNQDLVGTSDNTISEFAVQSSGAVVGPLFGSPYTTASAPTSVLAVKTTPTGGAGGLFVYVTNVTTNNVTVYQVCTVADGTNCTTDDIQNGKMISGGAGISVGLDPIAMTADPTNQFLYVVNHTSSSVSGFRINPTTGALSALNPSTVSTGSGPVGIAMHSSGKFLFVSNNSSSNVSAFNADITSGALSNAVTVTSSAQPAGLVTK